MWRAYSPPPPPRKDAAQRSVELEEILLSKEQSFISQPQQQQQQQPNPFRAEKLLDPSADPDASPSPSAKNLNRDLNTIKAKVDPSEAMVEEEKTLESSSGLALWMDQKNITAETRKAIVQTFGYPTMTAVQQKVCELLPTDQDLLVRAKTGTGKTLAFLVAAYENVMKKGGFGGRSASVLILSPTRELALQISNEAKRFVLGRGLTVRTLIGGEDRKRQKTAITMDGKVNFIVATPGRLIDFLQTERVMKKRMEELKVVIFDEADQLLEMGFREAMETISGFLPESRQTFMFSATLSTPIRKIADRVLKQDRISLDTVPVDDVPTHMNVKQTYIVAPFSQHLPVLYKLITDHRQNVPNAKTIVFFPTTKAVQALSDLFNRMEGIDIMTIHSKMDQRQRTRISDRFRKSRSAILFTTDVSARGVDYPGVTFVVQVGVPTSADQYVHRIGRTGRAGRGGEGVLLVSPYEKRFLETIVGVVPVKKSFEVEPNLVARDEEIVRVLGRAFEGATGEMRECFMAYLGYCE
ncbi:hypothetical protein HDU67_001470 [Dinochytrium kinnereticum]|nr:hypothetical protein HDU67_001470 [Dinochytrium kinnereticum]